MRLLRHAAATAVFLWIILAFPGRGLAQVPSSSEQEQVEKPLIVFLVRHAEKAGAGKNPELSEPGKRRAVQLANQLRNSEIKQVHSTDFIRTRKTAAPVAKILGLKTSPYDPRNLRALAKKLKAEGGRHLVVGHSNTTPALVKLLGGKPGGVIDEKGEFDRLYIVTIGPGGATSTVLMHYGNPFGARKASNRKGLDQP